MSAGRVACVVAPVLCLVFIASVASAAGATCNALVSLDDRWYVSDEEGTLSAPFNAGTARAFGVSLSDDAEHVAYLQGEGDGRAEFFIAGKSAEPYRFVEEMDGGARSPDVKWMSTDVIRTEMGYHVMPAFKFYRVRYDNGMTRLDPILRPNPDLLSNAGSGMSCVPNPKVTKVACVYGYGVEIDGKSVYGEDPFEHAELVDRFDMKFDEWHCISNMEEPGEDPRTIHVTAVRAELQHGQIHVAIRYGDPTVDGHEEGGYMRPPSPIAMTSADGLVSVSVSIGAKSKMPSVEVRRRVDDIAALDPALAWLPDGRGIAFVKYAGNRLVVMKQVGSRKWSKAGDFPFGRSDALESVRFVDASTVFVQGQDNAALYSLSISPRSKRPGKGLQLIRTLPHKIEVHRTQGPVTVPVITWECR